MRRYSAEYIQQHTDDPAALLATLTDAEIQALQYDWQFWARDKQLPPEGDWRYWLLLAGRGFGKTRAGAEMVREWIRQGYEYVNLIGATANDARSIMVEGESGILAICRDDERPDYKRHIGELHWPNGAKSIVFSADQPERLRGKQHMKLWPDELASWRYPESWTQAKFGLRLGNNPQAVITTTPRPTKLIKDLIAHDKTVITEGTTYDNRANLADGFFADIIGEYEGTRLGRQELLAHLLDDIPGALWTRVMIEAAYHVSEFVPLEMKRIVVAVDPAVTHGEDADDTGIVVAGIGYNGIGYVLADLTLNASPGQWAAVAVNAYHDYNADLVVAETNNGGDLVELTIRTIEPLIPYKKVHASRGKLTRAAPVAALYEQEKVHHQEPFHLMEDQMCTYVPGEKSPDRMDALVWALTELMLGKRHEKPKSERYIR